MLQRFYTWIASGAILLAMASGAPVLANGVYFGALVDSSQEGNNTGVMVTAGQTVSVRAMGYAINQSNQQPASICTPDSDSCWSTPAGYGNGAGSTDPDCLAMSLIGHIAGSSTYHCLGKAGSFTADATGDLILLVNDAPGSYANNFGYYTAIIRAR